MRRVWICLVVFGLYTGFCAAAARPTDVTVHHIGPRAVSISCKDGADPTYDPTLSKALGEMVVSCGTAR